MAACYGLSFDDVLLSFPILILLIAMNITTTIIILR